MEFLYTLSKTPSCPPTISTFKKHKFKFRKTESKINPKRLVKHMIICLHLVVPSWLNFRHSILAICIISSSSFRVSECTTTNWVNDNEKNEHDNIKNRELMPVSSCSLKHGYFARIAVVAQYVGCPVPSVAIRILHVLAACTWWLAAPRLQPKFVLYISFSVFLLTTFNFSSYRFWTYSKFNS